MMEFLMQSDSPRCRAILIMDTQAQTPGTVYLTEEMTLVSLHLIELFIRNSFGQVFSVFCASVQVALS